MKKLLLIITVMFLPVISACEKVETKYIEVPAKSEPKTTTVMVYMVGSNLISGAENNLRSMLQAESSDKLNVVIQTGAGNKDVQDMTLQSYEDYNRENGTNEKMLVDWMKVNRYTVKNGELNKIASFSEKNSCNEGGSDPNCLNMLTNDNLKDFINSAKKDYPADRYMLILWNHGGGPILGYGSETSLEGSFSMSDLYDVLKNSDIGHYDLIGFDACLMGNIEIAKTLSPFTDYVLGSEEIEPGNGWSYAEFLTELATNPSVSMDRVGKIIADNYLVNNNTQTFTTLSLIETNDYNMYDIIDSLDTVASKLITEFDNNNKKQEAYYKYIQSKLESRRYNYDHLVDSINFAENLNAEFFDYNGDGIGDDQDLINLMTSFRSAILYNVVNTGYQEGSNGLTMYAPLNNKAKLDGINTIHKMYKDFFYNNTTASNMNFSQKYIEFLDKIFTYQDKLVTDHPDEPAFTDTYNDGNGTLEVNITSHVGFEIALVVADTDDNNTNGIQAATSGLMEDCKTEDYVNYSCSYTHTGKVFGLKSDVSNEFRPLYLQLNKKVRHNQELYQVRMPIFVEIGDVWKQGELIFKFDIEKYTYSEIDGVSFVYDKGAVGLPLEAQVQLADVVIKDNIDDDDQQITRDTDGGTYTVGDLVNNIGYDVAGTVSNDYEIEVIDVLGNSNVYMLTKLN